MGTNRHDPDALYNVPRVQHIHAMRNVPTGIVIVSKNPMGPTPVYASNLATNSNSRLATSPHSGQRDPPVLSTPINHGVEDLLRRSRNVHRIDNPSHHSPANEVVDADSRTGCAEATGSPDSTPCGASAASWSFSQP